MIIDVLGYFCCSMMIFRLNKYRIRTERMDVFVFVTGVI